MTAQAEYPPEIDVATADEMISGSLPWIDVPEGYEGITALISAVRRGVAPMDSGWGAPTVAAMALRISREQANRTPDRRRRRLVGSVPHMAAAITAFAVLSSGAAVAAAGQLPSPMQAAASDVASIVGVSLPTTNDPDPSTPAASHPAAKDPAASHSAGQAPMRDPAETPATGPARAIIDATSKPPTASVTAGTPANQTTPATSTAPITTATSPDPISSTATPSAPATASPTTPGAPQVSPNHGSPAGSNSGRGVGPGTHGGHGTGG